MLTKYDLAQFTGTEAYHHFNILAPNVLLTDGGKYLADKAGAYWLMDVIASYLPKVDDTFAVAKLAKDGEAWEFRLEDGNDNAHATQTILYSDFPFDEMTLFVVRQDDLWIVMLPSEY